MKHASNMHVVSIYGMQFSCMQVVHASSCKNPVTCMLHAQRSFVVEHNIAFKQVTMPQSYFTVCSLTLK